MNSYEHQKLRKQYYRAKGLPFCECGGTWHYDHDICEFVCDECGATVKVIDITRSKKRDCKKKEPGKCWYCGKPLTGRQKKFCTLKCNKLYYKKQNWNESIINGKDLGEYFKQKNIDEDLEITGDDNKWGLGESSLAGKKLNDFKNEQRVVKKEKERLLGRKPNP